MHSTQVQPAGLAAEMTIGGLQRRADWHSLRCRWSGQL